ncbi:helix-turn-helix transcriptional regulator [Pelagovum pacificum]|nr:helix-turn-helix domain-containing protein [Pelagovum pacificum]
MLSERALAARWVLSTRTLQRWRSDGYGPAFLNIGGSIRYRLGDILAYEAQHRQGGDDL